MVQLFMEFLQRIAIGAGVILALLLIVRMSTRPRAAEVNRPPVR